jgi:hypothetical protein
MDITKLSIKECAELQSHEGNSELDRRVMEEQDRIVRLSIEQLTALLLARSIRPDKTDIRLRAVRDELLTRLDV